MRIEDLQLFERIAALESISVGRTCLSDICPGAGVAADLATGRLERVLPGVSASVSMDIWGVLLTRPA